MFINEQSLISLNGMPQYVSIRAQKRMRRCCSIFTAAPEMPRFH